MAFTYLCEECHKPIVNTWSMARKYHPECAKVVINRRKRGYKRAERERKIERHVMEAVSSGQSG
jgi:hypothetical protein